MSNEFLDKDGLNLVAEQIKKKTTSFVGTAAQWDSAQNDYPKGTIVALTDDVDNTYESGEYSTNEIVTGKTWINGKPIYRKVIDCGGLPDSDTKNVIHNISDIDEFIHVEGIAYQNNKTTIPINYINPTAIGNSIGLYVNATDVIIITTTNLTNYVQVYVFLEYTKTTD